MKRCVFGYVVIAVLISSGCASYRYQAADAESIKVSVEPSRETRLSNVSVRRTDDVMEIRGVVRPASVTISLAGHVDIRLHDVQGNVVRALKARPSSSVFVRGGVQKRLNKPRFHLSIPVHDMEISEVQLIPHNVPFDTCDLVRG